jgi:hypothetical protein
MRSLKRSARQSPKVSIVLLDWSVRESFHLLHYLQEQDVPRDQFEVILIEYYSRVSPAAERFAPEIDTWALLDMPAECYYHKHLMYNAGLTLSRGDVCVFCDSDAMVKPTFVGAILKQFDSDPDVVLHLDPFRNTRRDLYPFSYPSFEEVLGAGCFNNVNGKTRGLLDTVDPLHTRNYGACMCARRDDLLAIGGADEHIDFLGHICGPYDMTFRLVNLGRREIWHQSEFMYHTWHPGQDGVANYFGPHDGRHMSTTALEALSSGRVEPLEMNPAIRSLRGNGHAPLSDKALARLFFNADRGIRWLAAGIESQTAAGAAIPVLYRGYRIQLRGRGYVGRLILSDILSSHSAPILGATEDVVRDQIHGLLDQRVRMVSRVASLYVLGWRGIVTAGILLARLFQKARAVPGRMWPLLLAALRHLRRPAIRRRLWRGVRALLRAMRPRALIIRVRDSTWGLVTWTVNRWQRFLMERRFFAGTLDSLLVNLYFLGRVRQIDAEVQAPIVIVDRVAVSQYLRALFALRLIPPVEVIRVASSAELDDRISALSASGWSGHFIVGRDLYARHFGTLSRLRLSHRLVVV